MKSFFFTFFTFFLAMASVGAQDIPYLRSFHQNWQWINPAAMDRQMMLEDKWYKSYTVLARQQWTSVDGAPFTGYVAGELKPESTLKGHKFAGMCYFDKADAFNSYGAKLNYSWFAAMPNSFDQILHFGFSFGVQNHGLNVQKASLHLASPDDPAILNFKNRFLVDLGFGMMLRGVKRYYIGISFPEMLRAYAWKQGGEKGLYGNRQLQQVYIIAGGYINLGDTGYKHSAMTNNNLNETDAKLMLEPSLIVRWHNGAQFNTFIDRSPITADLNFRLYGLERFWTGLGGSTNGTIAIELGMNIKREADYRSGHRIGFSSSLPFFAKSSIFGPGFELVYSYFIH